MFKQARQVRRGLVGLSKARSEVAMQGKAASPRWKEDSSKMTEFLAYVVCFAGAFIGGGIWGSIAYRRGFRDGQLKTMLHEFTREENHDRASRHSRME